MGCIYRATADQYSCTVRIAFCCEVMHELDQDSKSVA